MHKTFIGRLAAGLILLLTATFASHARTVYGPVSASGATSVFVAGGTHGIASRYIGLVATTSSGTRLNVSDYSITVNVSTYDVSVTFNAAFTGSYRLVGAYSSYTTSSHDFQLTGAVDGLQVCGTCTSGSPAYAARSLTQPDSGVAHNFAMDEQAALTVLSQMGSGDVYAYLTQRGIVFQIPTNMSAAASGGNASVVQTASPSTRPYDGVVLGRGSYFWGKLQSVTDLRGF